MQAFGIELRKTNNTNLYMDVDRILSGPKFAVIQVQTVAHAIQRMFQPNLSFDVCCIKECAKICSVHIPQEHMDIYQTLHCHDWSTMLPEYREYIIAMVLNDFRGILLFDINS